MPALMPTLMRFCRDFCFYFCSCPFLCPRPSLWRKKIAGDSVLARAHYYTILYTAPPRCGVHHHSHPPESVQAARGQPPPCESSLLNRTLLHFRDFRDFICGRASESRRGQALFGGKGTLTGRCLDIKMPRPRSGHLHRPRPAPPLSVPLRRTPEPPCVRG